jgi:hypothetical protein
MRALQSELPQIGTASQDELRIPIYNVDEACKFSSLPAACIRDEQSSYDYLRSIWSSLPENIRRFSLDQMQKHRTFKYQIGAQWVNSLQERDRRIARQSGSPTFRP